MKSNLCDLWEISLRAVIRASHPRCPSLNMLLRSPEPANQCVTLHAASPRSQALTCHPLSSLYPRCTLCGRMSGLTTLTSFLPPQGWPKEMVYCGVCMLASPGILQMLHWGNILQFNCSCFGTSWQIFLTRLKCVHMNVWAQDAITTRCRVEIHLFSPYCFTVF